MLRNSVSILTQRSRVALAALAMAVVAIQAAPAFGCGYDLRLGDVPTPSHLRSLDVAIAMFGAVDAGILEPVARSPRDLGPLGYLGAVRRLDTLKAFLRDLAAIDPLPRSFALVLVESALWSRYQIQDGTVNVQYHIAGPDPGDIVVVTGEAVLDALIAGRLSIAGAVQRDLLIVDGGGARSAETVALLARAFE